MSMNTFEIPFEKAHELLHQPNDTSRLGLACSELVAQLQQALQNKELSRAWKILQQLENFSCRAIDDREVAEVMLECGAAAFHLGNYEKAIPMLKKSVDLYRSDLHRQAVAQWMLGCVLLETRAHQGEWLALWQDSLKKFSEVAGKRYSSAAAVNWYQGWADKMRKDIQRVICEECA